MTPLSPECLGNWAPYLERNSCGMNDKKICFIMCTNNKQYSEESAYYISRLNIPEGYTIELLTIWDAKSMTSGYNEGMNSSDAKYKIYLHQDVFIWEKDFLFHILRLFSNPQIGMIGMVGTPKLCENAIMWNYNRVGILTSCSIKSTAEHLIGAVEDDYQKVEAIDGLLMATQYDIPWREDIFKKWDFYDVSQSFEFRKAGYDVVVPRMEHSWVLHDDGYLNLDNYYKEREIFLKEYNWGAYRQ